jgi:6-phosphogluconolactonase/glucosamine-6-phosphate isomerase/deaminase
MYAPPIVVSTVPSHLVCPTAATIIADKIAFILENKGTCLVGLSGSTSLHSVYANMGKEKVDWSRVTFFAVDEIFVPGISFERRMILFLSTSNKEILHKVEGR